MTDRTPATPRVAAAPTGPLLVLPLTTAMLERHDRSGRDGLPADLWDRVRQARSQTRFDASAGQQLPVLGPKGELIWLLGLGKDWSSRGLCEAAATATGLPPAGRDWCLVLSDSADDGAPTEWLAAATEGVLLGPYRFKTTKEPGIEPAGACTIATPLDAERARSVVERARALSEGVWLARDLINTPADVLGPSELADAARVVAERHGMTCRTLRGAEVERRGFRLVAAVGRAAAKDRQPTVTVVEHRLEGRDPELAIVGKGVVFDTGGLDIKTQGFMQLMRKDMGGAGTVIGALDSIGRLGVDLPFVAVLPSSENAIGPDAMRPGDVLHAYDGQTVEIGNTDAEGRLLLADGLAHARELGARKLLDVATLTGAARVALGPDLPALFGTDEELVDLLRKTSIRHDEELWRLPLVDRYNAWIDTPWADVNNSGSDRRAGAITAALFLKRFARDTPWAHVDLYAWEDRGVPGTPRGANGMTVRTLAATVEALARG